MKSSCKTPLTKYDYKLTVMVQNGIDGTLLFVNYGRMQRRKSVQGLQTVVRAAEQHTVGRQRL